ncbi:copper homeostasis protein CutC [Arthrobacter livingstonensis]|uniref:PF03932 family protein CutC n=1 Tax=Arthrobacter livingstonensis TaxID=670078 RepID=A0A2V5LBW2_9MICC|nr:copper homeostasis protein CutC [Arthrobacter livingstonensis]PYI69131.1 copper homeostasis protein CutC [Arthrobacter livingstonensis]
MAKLEIAVQDVAGTRAALAGGADRIELCSALAVGGLTPSAGTAEASVEAAARRDGFVHALVRSRPGGYVYDADEVDTMCRDIRVLKAAGVHGVVVGALTAGGEIDLATLARWVEAAGGLPVTFHRALDASRDPMGQLMRLAGTGVGRVLSSGGRARAIEGLDMLGAMRRGGPEGIEVMAGGGVRAEDIRALVGTGVDAVHLSARESYLDPHPAGPGGGAQELDATSVDLVTRAQAECAAQAH